MQPCRRPIWARRGGIAADVLARTCTRYYGKSHILHGVTLRVGEGEIVSLLGRNGVGRSTTVEGDHGPVRRTGSLRFEGAALIGPKPYKIARRGLGYVPENRDIFPTLTVGRTCCSA